jgi:large subunit ribosomal protein L4
MAKAVKLKEIAELGISEANHYHIQESYLRQVAHGSPVTARKKSKSEVQATGAKWYRQKGTGRARQGETTNPHMTGGGLAFPPQPRTPRKKLNKHVRRSALRSAVQLHLDAGTAQVIQGQDFNEITRTKVAAELLSKISNYETICLVAPKETSLWRATRNIWNVRMLAPAALNVRDLVESRYLVFTQAALDEFKAMLGAQDSAPVEIEPAEAGEPAAPEPAADDGQEDE